MKIIVLKKILLVFLIAFFGMPVKAQDVYLSISGKNAPFLSGDSRHQYDIWIKPDTTANDGTLQIYDAGLGGSVDQITSKTLTTTSYSVFPFNEVYDVTNEKLTETSSSPEPLSSLITKDEERYKNRWVTLTNVESKDSGYIIRVTADDGFGVNNFNLRVVNSAGEVLTGHSWKIITIDLSIGLYGSSPGNHFQIKPYNWSRPISQSLEIHGEEDSEVVKLDAFGKVYPQPDAVIPPEHFGIENSWGLQLSGSQELINNLTVYGVDEPVLWLFEPILIEDYEQPEISVNYSGTTTCTEKVFDLRSSIVSRPVLQKASWFIDGTLSATGHEPEILFNEGGDVSLDILVPNENSYFPQYWIYRQDVFINTPPVARLSVPKTIISPSESVLFSAEGSYDPEERPLTYTWFVNGSRRGSGPTFQFSNTISGSYNISVQVYDGGNSQNCSITQEETTIRVNTQPYAEMQYRQIFGTDEQVTFSAINESDADNDILYYLWEGPGISENSFGKSVKVSHSAAGSYQIQLTVDDSSKASNSAFSIIKNYEVNAAPIAQFTSPEKVAPEDEIELDASSSIDSNDGLLSYRWYVDENKIAETKTTKFSLSNPGDYGIRLIVDDGRQVSNSVQETNKRLRVNDAPNAVIIAPEIISSSHVTLAADSTAGGGDKIKHYNWNFGDGNGASGPNVQHTYNQSGTYRVTLTVDDGEGLANSIQSSTHFLTVNKFPNALFEIPDVVAPGEIFTADGSYSIDEDGFIDEYSWFIDGIPSGTGEVIDLDISSTGLHDVSLRVKDNSGFDNAQSLITKSIRVNKSPVAKWKTLPKQIVPDETVTFSAEDSFDPDGEIRDFIWIFEDGTELKGAQVEHSFSQSGSQQFSLEIVDSEDLSNSSTKIEGTIQVNHQPYIITESAVRSNSMDVKLDASSSYDLDNDPVHFEWILPDGSKRNEATFSWKAPEAGVHIISLIVDDGLGLANSKNEELIRVLINQPVKAMVDSMITSCTGRTVLFNSSRSFDPDGDAFRVNWDFGNGETSDEANPTFSYEKPGIYDAKLTMSDGFSDSETIAKIPVIIEGSPVARMNISDTTICVNSALDFDGSASTDPSGSLPSFSWDMGDGNSSTGAKARHIFTEPGEYTVSLTVEGSGSGQCSNVSQVSSRIKVIEGPTAKFDLPDWSAPGEEVQLNASESLAEGGFKNAEWLIENADTSYTRSGLNTSHVFSEAGEYFVTLNLETNTVTSCNTVSLTKSIKVNAQPEIEWELPEAIAAGTDLLLDATSSKDPDGYIKKYKWFFNDSLISNNAAEIIKTIEPGTHTITLEITDNSQASNKSNRLERTFFANSSPEPSIVAPVGKFLNEQVVMHSAFTKDVDGDELISTWILDGKEIDQPKFIPSEVRNHRMVLIQNDGRNLSNSIDSAVVEFIPLNIPEANVEYPAIVEVDTELTIPEINAAPGWKFIHNNSALETWKARKAGKDSLSLGWINEDQILERRAFPITIVEKLDFVEEAEEYKIEWNPANSTAIIKAPEVNRELKDVKYIWSRDGVEIGHGIQLEATLAKGINIFTVEVSDVRVQNSTKAVTEVQVQTQ